MRYLVTMHLGDGTSHEIGTFEADDEEDAMEDARTYVKNNHWYEVEEAAEEGS